MSPTPPPEPELLGLIPPTVERFLRYCQLRDECRALTLAEGRPWPTFEEAYQHHLAVVARGRALDAWLRAGGSRR